MDKFLIAIKNWPSCWPDTIMFLPRLCITPTLNWSRNICQQRPRTVSLVFRHHFRLSQSSDPKGDHNIILDHLKAQIPTGIRMHVRARCVCGRIGLLIAELRQTLVPRDDQALKQLISDFLNMSVLRTPLNDAEIKHALCGIPRQSNPQYMGVLGNLGERSKKGGDVTYYSE